MSINPALREAVNRYRLAEEELKVCKILVADLLAEASKTQQVTMLSEYTGIQRTTIYWLIRVWSTSANKDRGLRS